MNLDDMTEMAFTRLTWREKMAARPRALLHLLRRLLRREHRFYLVLDGKVMAKFVAAEDHPVVLDWIAVACQRSMNYGVVIGKEHIVAQHLAAADAGDPGPS